ncbi:hypothetical protein Tc00.1047053508273.130 [Trypanosoma cruzi]|uniref:Uncharacterized protein n=1 Tax=Trypanosoma cruzi (strain CL Brener) TaxID=353153 RepID=Q4DAI9_TRYCC|nr:hypothetical protein Tc00.1047053508273.130 [Trypanosoma cruzi]EAN89550.1 hypothetical protein Tc00.1047053508273.130 [Trypanosoma cruzi]|eukprot:XP_811401.1 hypothetical protein [Trypanosoma cruzi strain CL Brener]
MQGFEGATMSHREHFLLVDPDFESDAVILGSTQEALGGECHEAEGSHEYLHQVGVHRQCLLLRHHCAEGSHGVGADGVRAAAHEPKLLTGHYDDFFGGNGGDGELTWGES